MHFKSPKKKILPNLTQTQAQMQCVHVHSYVCARELMFHGRHFKGPTSQPTVVKMCSDSCSHNSDFLTLKCSLSHCALKEDVDHGVQPLSRTGDSQQGFTLPTEKKKDSKYYPTGLLKCQEFYSLRAS